MKFAVLTKPYRFEIEDRPYPELKDQYVLITVKKVGICGSEITAYRGTHKYRIPPVILGHEMVGSVSMIGREVKKFRIGDRVVVKPHTFCGQCPDCLNGNQNFCKEKIVLGSREWPGAFGEFIVSHEYLVHRLPPSISDDEAALLDPLCVGLHAVRIAKVQAGDRVAIFGAGSIGLSTLLVAQTTGAEVYITDVKALNIEIAKKLGATDVFDVSTSGGAHRFNELVANMRLDTIFIAAGVESAVPHALEMVRRGGQVVVIAHFHNPIIPLDMFTLMTQEKRVQGSITYTSLDLGRGIQLLAQKKVNVSPLISEQRSLEEIQSCFERLAAGEERLIKVLLNP
ncbi:MAG: alcohol dehydrogenase catalytic domain-containing protein [Thermodesulfobacteriota bacterium]|nr:alcohol dehydrogenase catalytic domain-containing protein [Thermodesulfobacteriota bacterium]